LRGKTGLLNRAASPHVKTFLRPHLIGPFSDLLIAAVTSPLMLLYLDQIGSVGPNSERVSNRPDAGLNENLARELLELHTLGVTGPYLQSDVQEVIKVLAGLHVRMGVGQCFDVIFPNPGPRWFLANPTDQRHSRYSSALDQPRTAPHNSPTYYHKTCPEFRVGPARGRADYAYDNALSRN
jgi:hypothetical protein